MDTTAKPSAPGLAAPAPERITLSLVSHTNVGKTTLARTLLGRDIGEVRDAPHVTEFADRFELLHTEHGETLDLWDTPGFGDSLRLLRRVRMASNPLSRLLSEVWDRWRDRPFWHSQQALRHVRDSADVVLYLVNAAETPQAAAYVQPELELLAWTGKPVIVLLNQLGAPRGAEVENAELERWKAHLRDSSAVRDVLPLDAFARCWVQEFALFDAVLAAVPTEQHALMGRLAAAWRARRLATFDAAMTALANGLARLAMTRVSVPEAGLRERLREVGSALGMASAPLHPAVMAEQALADTFAAESRDSTAQLLALHGLSGRAQGEILARLDTLFELRARIDESKAGLLGGALTGALAGLKADLATGGLTLGGGLLAGGVLGALGGAALARGYNRITNRDQSWLAWSPQALGLMAEAALLRYLAVAHFGRGRGDWQGGEAPAHWAGVVAAALEPQRTALAEAWSRRGAAAPDAAAEQALAAALKPLLVKLGQDVLLRLYPGTRGLQ